MESSGGNLRFPDPLSLSHGDGDSTYDGEAAMVSLHREWYEHHHSASGEDCHVSTPPSSLLDSVAGRASRLPPCPRPLEAPGASAAKGALRCDSFSDTSFPSGLYPEAPDDARDIDPPVDNAHVVNTDVEDAFLEDSFQPLASYHAKPGRQMAYGDDYSKLDGRVTAAWVREVSWNEGRGEMRDPDLASDLRYTGSTANESSGRCTESEVGPDDSASSAPQGRSGFADGDRHGRAVLPSASDVRQDSFCRDDILPQSDLDVADDLSVSYENILPLSENPPKPRYRVPENVMPRKPGIAMPPPDHLTNSSAATARHLQRRSGNSMKLQSPHTMTTHRLSHGSLTRQVSASSRHTNIRLRRPASSNGLRTRPAARQGENDPAARSNHSQRLSAWWTLVALACLICLWTTTRSRPSSASEKFSLDMPGELVVRDPELLTPAISQVSGRLQLDCMVSEDSVASLDKPQRATPASAPLAIQAFDPLEGLLRDSTPQHEALKGSKLGRVVAFALLASFTVWLSRLLLSSGRVRKPAADVPTEQVAHLVDSLKDISMDDKVMIPKVASVLTPYHKRWPCDETVAALICAVDPQREARQIETDLRDKLRAGRGGKLEWGLLACVVGRLAGTSASDLLWEKYADSTSHGVSDTADRLALIDLFVPKDANRSTPTAEATQIKREEPASSSLEVVQSATRKTEVADESGPADPRNLTVQRSGGRRQISGGVAQLKDEDRREPLRRSPRLRGGRKTARDG